MRERLDGLTTWLARTDWIRREEVPPCDTPAPDPAYHRRKTTNDKKSFAL
jgi:hypothetical protein